jgi:hypothetical protein
VRRAALALLAVTLLAAGGCGDDDGGANSESATQLLERGFATDVDTGVVTLDAEIELEGGPVEGPFRLELEGPFRVAESATEMPDADLAFRAEGAGQVHEGRAIVTRENAWVELRGETYEVGEEHWAGVLEGLEAESRGEPRTFAEAGLDPMDWVADAEESGEEDVGGTAATKVTGALDIRAMLRDVNRIAAGARVPGPALSEVDEAVDDVEFEAWIGEDGIWRRISAGTDFRVPEEEQASAGGLEGGSVSFEMDLNDPNQPVEIEGPAEARPLDELLRSLGIPPELFLGPGFAAPTPG